MIKKFLYISIIVFIGFVVALFSPWREQGGRILGYFGFKTVVESSGLEVYSFSDPIDVYIDNKLVGTVDESNLFYKSFSVKEGTHKVSLKKTSSPDSYHSVSKLVSFHGGVNNVFAYELGPSEQFSQGYILTSKKISNFENRNYTNLQVNVLQKNSEIVLNGKILENGKNYKVDLDTTSHLLVQKKGYESMDITLFPEDIKERRKLSQYDMELEITLFLKPFNV